MSFVVKVMPAAEADMRRNLEWWDEHRSKEQADRWYLRIHQAIESLSKMPKRYALAPEAEQFGRAVHQMPFGVSARPTHRVLYTVEGNVIEVLRVLHGSQDDISEAGDLQ